MSIALSLNVHIKGYVYICFTLDTHNLEGSHFPAFKSLRGSGENEMEMEMEIEVKRESLDPACSP